VVARHRLVKAMASAVCRGRLVGWLVLTKKMPGRVPSRLAAL